MVSDVGLLVDDGVGSVTGLVARVVLVASLVGGLDGSPGLLVGSVD